jgi:hypothetical protein
MKCDTGRSKCWCVEAHLWWFTLTYARVVDTLTLGVHISIRSCARFLFVCHRKHAMHVGRARIVRPCGGLVSCDAGFPRSVRSPVRTWSTARPLEDYGLTLSLADLWA